MSTFNILLYSSLLICTAGLAFRIGRWFVLKIGIYGKNSSVARRVSSALKGMIRVIFSLNALKIIQSIVTDAICQRRILVKAGFVRWLAHILIFCGFMSLLVMHALDDLVTRKFFADYYATLNPFLFLRSLFGVLVILGLVIAVGRRFLSRKRRVRTTGMDVYAVFIVAFIILSGIFLEGLTMTSYSEFERMLSDYAGLYDEEEIRALEGFWVEHYALVSPTTRVPVDAELLALGEEINETYCMSCHVSNKWGFLGYSTAQAISPFARWLDRNNGVTIFWYFHIVACFLGLAMLPFTKMFHIVSVSVSMIAGAVRGDKRYLPENLATINAMELDACTHCGVCSQSCSAVMMSEVMGNEYILPSEKMGALKKMMRHRKINSREVRAVLQGVYVCTSCERCTVACPSGIRLKDLWENVREGLIQSHVPEPSMLSPFSFVRGTRRKMLPGSIEKIVEGTLKAVCGNGYHGSRNKEPFVFSKTGQTAETKELVGAVDYSACFDCRNCTTICPVVGNYENPEESLGLLPHQIMSSLGLNLIKPASRCAMLWFCLTCYQCQEHCPQNVPVCDNIYSLKNLAAKQLEDARIL